MPDSCSLCDLFANCSEHNNDRVDYFSSSGGTRRRFSNILYAQFGTRNPEEKDGIRWCLSDNSYDPVRNESH
jgi:hypothetical protein